GASFTAITDNGDGTYTVSYTPTVAGSDEIAITLDGVAISGSPYTSSVEPGPISVGADGSELSVDKTSVIANGVSAATVTFQLRDEYGNAISQEGVQVSFATTHGTLSAATATTDANGAASVSLTAAAAGMASVTAGIT